MTYRSPAFLCTRHSQLQYLRCARPGFTIGYALVVFLHQHVSDWTPTANISGRFKTPLHPCALSLHSGADNNPRPSNLGNKANGLKCRFSILAPNYGLGTR